MSGFWTSFKPFPDADRGENIEAPIGPGVYEVRRISSGDVVAFDHAPNVATALSALQQTTPRGWLFGRHRNDVHDLEYRTCAAATKADAKAIATRLRGRREVFWRRVQALPT